MPRDADLHLGAANGLPEADIQAVFQIGPALRDRLGRRFPSCDFYWQPADIVSQILSFGLPSPIDIQIVGRDYEANRRFASGLMKKVLGVPGIVDLRVHQVANQPSLEVDVDRTRAAQVGLTQRDVANNLLVSLSGSAQTSPTFWLNPSTGVTYSVATMTPQYRMNSLQDLATIPVSAAGGAPSQSLCDAPSGRGGFRLHRRAGLARRGSALQRYPPESDDSLSTVARGRRDYHVSPPNQQRQRDDP